MLEGSLSVFAAAVVTAFLVREKLRWYEASAAIAALGLAYAGGVYAFTPARVAEWLWLAALPLAAYVLLLIWYRLKCAWVPASLFVIVPPAAVFAGYVVVGPFDTPAWLERVLAGAARASDYNGWSVAGLAKLFFVLSGLVYLSAPANTVIRGILKPLGVFPENDGGPASPADKGKSTAGRGAIIGVLERWIAFALVLAGQYTALAFVIAAKSIARYKKINEEEKFGEYFLIGTLASIGIALLFGIIVRKVPA